MAALEWIFPRFARKILCKVELVLFLLTDGSGNNKHLI